MHPRVIMSNAISLNGGLTGFPVDLGVYYRILLGYRPDMVLVGSNTVLAAHDEIPPEEETDFGLRVPEPGDERPYWVVADSGGKLEGILHFYRRMEYIKDIILLVTEETPPGYLRYLEERKYATIIAGTDRVDFTAAFHALGERYGAATIVTDTGGTLNSVLLDASLVDEISVLVAPVLAGRIETPLFMSSKGEGGNVVLRLTSCEVVGGGYVHLVYGVR
jgi:2,5-diamino-6-(ribosylamino)-4(3H)-pyrimidinone 5'-phosphate reductase